MDILLSLCISPYKKLRTFYWSLIELSMFWLDPNECMTVTSKQLENFRVGGKILTNILWIYLTGVNFMIYMITNFMSDSLTQRNASFFSFLKFTSCSFFILLPSIVICRSCDRLFFDPRHLFMGCMRLEMKSLRSCKTRRRNRRGMESVSVLLPSQNVKLLSVPSHFPISVSFSHSLNFSTSLMHFPQLFVMSF